MSCSFRRNPYTKHGWSRLNGRPQVWCCWLLPRTSVKPDLEGFLFCFSFTDIELVCRKKPTHKSWIHFVYNLNICIHSCYPHHNQRDQYSQHLPKFLYVPLMLLMVVHVCVHMCEEHLPWDLLFEQTFKCTIPYCQPWAQCCTDFWNLFITDNCNFILKTHFKSRSRHTAVTCPLEVGGE